MRTKFTALALSLTTVKILDLFGSAAGDPSASRFGTSPLIGDGEMSRTPQFVEAKEIVDEKKAPVDEKFEHCANKLRTVKKIPKKEGREICRLILRTPPGGEIGNRTSNTGDGALGRESGGGERVEEDSAVEDRGVPEEETPSKAIVVETVDGGGPVDDRKRFSSLCGKAGQENTNICPRGSAPFSTVDACRDYANSKSDLKWKKEVYDENEPKGCWHLTGGVSKGDVYFNRHPIGASKSGRALLCACCPNAPTGATYCGCPAGKSGPTNEYHSTSCSNCPFGESF